MIDYDIYNERRQQLIESFEDCINDLLDILSLDTAAIIDLIDWEDSEKLADLMGWVEEDS